MRALLLSLLAAFAPQLSAQHGHWSGAISAGGLHPLEVDFDARSIAVGGAKPQAIDNLSFAGTSVSFEWPEEGDARALFDGALVPGAIEGTFAQGATRGTFRLVRTAALPAEAFDAVRGLYERGGRLLWIGRMSEIARQPAMVDVHSGRFAVLYPSSRTAWFTSPRGDRVVFTDAGLTLDGARFRRVDCCDEEELTGRAARRRSPARW